MRYVIFGESHGPAIGVVLEGVPAGLELDLERVSAEMARRAPGGSPLSTARKEADVPEILSGLFEGRTTGTPLCAVIANTDTRSRDYAKLKDLPRPGHGDYAGYVRYQGCNDYRGGGHFSGRLTAPLVFAGAVAKQLLEQKGVQVAARISNVAGIPDPTPEQYGQAVLEARSQLDSVGGCIRCAVTGLPAGLGAPDYGENVEGIFSQYLFAVPAVKAVGFGDGVGFASLRGSQANDSFYMDGDTVKTRTNHSGGVNGGITNGMPVEFTVTFRPTPSIAQPQETIDLTTMTNTKITIGGRHDACIALRAPVVVESAAALALWRLKGADGGGELDNLRGQLDILDTELTALFVQRQSISRRIGAYKREHHLPVQDAGREEQVLHTRGDLLPERRRQVERLFRLLMELSREEQA